MHCAKAGCESTSFAERITACGIRAIPLCDGHLPAFDRAVIQADEWARAKEARHDAEIQLAALAGGQTTVSLAEDAARRAELCDDVMGSWIQRWLDTPDAKPKDSKKAGAR